MQRESRESQRRVAGGPLTRGVADVHLDDGRAPREDKGLRELLPADRAEHRLDSLAPVRVEGAAEVRDRNAREPAQHPVDQSRRERPAPRVVPGGAAPARDVVAGLDRLDEPGDVLGEVLQVAVHRHDDLASGPRETGVHRRVLAGVPLEPDRPDVRVVGVEALEDREGPVRRPVVDVEHLVRPVEGPERRGQAPLELLERPGLVEERHDDREGRPRRRDDVVLGRAQGLLPRHGLVERTRGEAPGLPAPRGMDGCDAREEGQSEDLQDRATLPCTPFRRGSASTSNVPRRMFRRLDFGRKRRRFDAKGGGIRGGNGGRAFGGTPRGCSRCCRDGRTAHPAPPPP